MTMKIPKYKTLTTIFIITIILGINSINSSVISITFAVICLWAFIGTKNAIQSLALNYTILLLNPAIVHLPGEAGLLRWVVLFIAAIRILPFKIKKSIRYFGPLLFFFIMVIVLSYLSSPNFLISFLKIFVFSVCAGTALSAFNSLEIKKLEEIKHWLLCLTASVIILSIPTLIVPSIGFFRNGRGFQGIFNHPQAFGVFIVPVASYLGAYLLLDKKNKKNWMWPAVAVLVIMIFISKARTALITFVLSILFTYIVTLINSRRKTSNLAPGRAVFKIGSIAAVLCMILAFSPTFSKSFEGFWLKSSENKNVGNAFYNSRGSGVAFYWKHFLESPLIGNGFGIDLGHQKDSKVTTFMGIPISSPTEEGFLPAAFMSEVGILGLIFFCPFFITLVKGALNSLDLGLMAMFFSCLLVNIGEAIFFSPGQTGGYLWLLMGLCTASGWRTKREV